MRLGVAGCMLVLVRPAVCLPTGRVMDLSVCVVDDQASGAHLSTKITGAREIEGLGIVSSAT